MIVKRASKVDAFQSTNTENEQSILTNNQPATSLQNSSTEQKPWDVLKATVSMRKLMEADGHTFDDRGKYAMCCCPFHDDSTPSFSVFPEDNYGRCFGCDWQGNIFEYEMQTHKVDFMEALLRLEKKSAKLVSNTPVNTHKHKAIIKRRFSDSHKREREQYLSRLSSEEWLLNRVCEARAAGGNTWKPKTIKRLADEGSLGWAGCLAFLYSTGTKYRKWPGRDFYWDENNIGNSLWREDRIATAEHIHLTEGETDAISLIDAGLEETPGVAVIAVPGASAFDAGWTHLFEGKKVTIWFDADEAGQRGLERIGDLLSGVASSVSFVDLKEVQ